MSDKKDEPAFPGKASVFVGGSSAHVASGGTGLTKRELFAMAAMQGILSSSRDIFYKDRPISNSFEAAALAVHYADALLAALEEKMP